MIAACEKLERFVDGELSPTEADAFRQHLTGCAKCDGELEELLHLQALAALHHQRTPEQRAPEPRPVEAVRAKWLRWPRWPVLIAAGGLASAAAALLLIVPGLFVQQPIPEAV